MSAQVGSRLFTAAKNGPRIVVLGAIHGDEHCGTKAIVRVMRRIRTEEIKLLCGSVRFVPVCNPVAFAQNVRYVHENLNRVFCKTATPQTNEARLANELCRILERGVDMLLDLHSTSASGPASVFVDYPTAKSEALAGALGVEYVLLDWPAVYANDPHGHASQGTMEYAHGVGALGITVECGQHVDPASVDTAERVILRALAHAKLIDFPGECVSTQRRVRMRTLEWKHADGDVFTRMWQHLDLVPKGSLIATRANGDEIRAAADFVMLLPAHRARVNEEWFYLGTLE
jgi:predicted deacylase